MKIAQFENILIIYNLKKVKKKLFFPYYITPSSLFSVVVSVSRTQQIEQALNKYFLHEWIQAIARVKNGSVLRLAWNL